MSQYLIILSVLGVLGVIGVGTYTWHQNRKSNHDERMTNIEDYSQYPMATFAGGCFWCSESDFEKTDGVVEVVSGYTGGNKENPSYKEVSNGATGHRESIQVYYDPNAVTYTALLDVFWRHINPTDAEGQFNDRGFQYSPAIYYHDEEQKRLAEESKKSLEESGKFEKITVPIIPFTKFYIAEDYHQDYHTKNGTRYKYYRGGSGRDAYIKETWGDGLKKAQDHGGAQAGVSCNFSGTPKEYRKLPDALLKDSLDPLAYKVTQEGGTEKPFDNSYWDNTEEGIYVDILSGEPLFSSTDKYKSGTGWPSFVKPLEEENVVLKSDKKLFITRTEVRSKQADSHLGHVFDDGPANRGGKRYCMNSAAMCFIPKDKLEEQGYGEYMKLFEK